MKTKIILIALVLTAFFSCKKDKDVDPQLSTTLATPLSATSCYVKASVPERGSYEILDYGFVYSTMGAAISITNGTKVSLGKQMPADTFSVKFSYENSSYYTPTYYVRAYITNSRGTAYGNSLTFQPLVISVSSVFPNTGKVGDQITILGNNFSTTPTDNSVKFNNTPAKVVSATRTKLIVEVPSGIQSSYYDSYINIYVVAGNQSINAANFSLAPSISSFYPKSGTFGTTVTLTGDNLNGITVKCNDVEVSYNSYYNTSTSFSFSIPYWIQSSKVRIKVSKGSATTLLDDVFSMDPLSVSSITPQKGYIGSTITVTGNNFNSSSSSYNTIKIGGASMSLNYSYSTTQISGQVPSLSSGTYDVEVSNGITSVLLPSAYTVVAPKVTSFSPSSGVPGTSVTILGEDLSPNATVLIYYNGYYSYNAPIQSQDASKIVFTIPDWMQACDIKFRVQSGIDLDLPGNFTIDPVLYTISSFSPTAATPGTEVTIKGTGFIQGSTDVRFGTMSTSILSITPTEIKVQVPSNAGTGNMKITVARSGYLTVSDSDFTIL